MKNLVDVIVQKFSSRKDATRPYVVAWDGLSGAGKTTIANKLHRELKKHGDVVVLHIDDYLVERNKRYNTGNEEWYEYYYLQWDIKSLTEHLFAGLFNNSSKLTLPFYNRGRDKVQDKEIAIHSNMIIVIEGIFLQRPEWKKFLDFTIFHNCPTKIRHSRALARDTYIGNAEEIIEKYENRYWLAETYYMNEIRPIDNADIVYTDEESVPE